MTPPPADATEEEYSSFLSSVTDEVFFAIQESVNRAKMTADPNAISAFVNFVDCALSLDYLKFVSRCCDVSCGHELYVSQVCNKLT